ncbi:MAG: 30S ribosomal protein S16, partial [Bacteroidaceae bacterium]|nr:30S ribosomal protein S16 [Bacteroidaceae bacterium]
AADAAARLEAERKVNEEKAKKIAERKAAELAANAPVVEAEPAQEVSESTEAPAEA